MKTIAVTVLLTGRFESPAIWKLEMPAGPRQEVAEQVFEISNAPPHFLSPELAAVLAKFPRTGLRSVSVGDVLVIQDPETPAIRHIATVEGFGFKFH